jgi:hypothetical protein
MCCESTSLDLLRELVQKRHHPSFPWSFTRKASAPEPCWSGGMSVTNRPGERLTYTGGPPHGVVQRPPWGVRQRPRHDNGRGTLGLRQGDGCASVLLHHRQLRKPQVRSVPSLAWVRHGGQR